jgi:hypothetical protein
LDGFGYGVGGGGWNAGGFGGGEEIGDFGGAGEWMGARMTWSKMGKEDLGHFAEGFVAQAGEDQGLADV